MIFNINERFDLSSGNFALVGNSPDLTWENRSNIYGLTGTNINYNNENYQILDVEISRGGIVDSPMKNRMIALKVKKIS